MAHPQKDTIYFDFVSQPSRAVVLFIRWDPALSCIRDFKALKPPVISVMACKHADSLTMHSPRIPSAVWSHLAS